MKLGFGKKRKKDTDAEADVDLEAVDKGDEEVAAEADEKPVAKPKPKGASGSGGQQFFIDHGEKIVIVLVILLAVWMGYSSYNVLKPRPKETSEELMRRARKIESTMATNKAPPRPLLKPEDLIGSGRATLRSSGYPMAPWDLVPVPRKKRGSPDLRPVRDLIAVADVPIYYVKDLRHTGRKGRIPERTAEEQKQYNIRQRIKLERREKTQDAIKKSKIAKEKKRHRDELRAIKKKYGDDPELRKEKETEEKDDHKKKLDALNRDDLDRTTVQELTLPPAFRLGGVRLPGQDVEGDDGKKAGKSGRKRNKDRGFDLEEVQVEARPCVLVKGLLPVQEQQSIYDEAFAAAHHFRPARDRPLYVEARLWRLEVKPGADLENLDWSKAKKLDYGSVRRMNGDAEIENWIVPAKEVIDARYVHDDTDRDETYGGRLTKALGPRVFRSWTTNGLASHPEVPLAVSSKKRAQAGAGQGPSQLAQKGKAPKKEKKPEAKPAKKKGIFDDEEDEDLGDFESVDEPVEEEVAEETVESSDPGEVPYRLVRIFDYDVELGKRYVYRLGVAMRNPNSADFEDIRDENVEDPELRSQPYVPKRKDWKATVWSEPTAPVFVPAGESLMPQELLEAIPEVREEEAEVIVRAIDLESNTLYQMRMSLARGGMAAGPGALYSINPVTRNFVRDPTMEMYTALTLIDVRGNQELAKNVSSPTLCLYMDEQGNLFQRDSYMDRKEVNQFVKLEEVFQRNAEREEEAGEDGDEPVLDGDSKDEEGFDDLFGGKD